MVNAGSVYTGAVYRENKNGEAYVVIATPKNKTNGVNNTFVVYSWLNTPANITAKEISELVPFDENVNFTGKTFTRELNDFLNHYSIVLSSEQVERLEDGETFENVVPQQNVNVQNAIKANGNSITIEVGGQKITVTLS